MRSSSQKDHTIHVDLHRQDAIKCPGATLLGIIVKRCPVLVAEQSGFAACC